MITLINESESQPYQGERLKVLRDLEGITQAELAESLGVTQSFLSRVEKGEKPFPESTAIAASKNYGIPSSFFQVESNVSAMGHFTFRKSSRARVRDEHRIKALYGEAARLFHDVSVESGYHETVLPEPADHEGDPEECAEALRRSCGLGPEDPVRNVTRLLERCGVGVVTHLDANDVDVSEHIGISRPNKLNNRPLVALTHHVPGTVQRLSLGHELGHWIFDRQLAAPVHGVRNPVEARAFRFAGALLLPEKVVRRRVTESLSLHAYLPIKADYGVSVSAILRRAKDLGVISSERYRSLSIQLSSQGWRRQEPVEVSEESPRLFHQALEQVFGKEYYFVASNRHGISSEHLGRWTNCQPEKLSNADLLDESQVVISIADWKRA